MIGVCISGGGAKIGFAVGVLEVMAERGIRPDLVYGISSGSLCTAALCYGDLAFLKDTLLTIEKRRDVLKNQWPKVLWTLLTKKGEADGWFEMDTMRRKLDTLPRDTPQIKGVVGYVKLRSGEIVFKSTSQTEKKEFLDAVQASCSIPVYMQTRRVNGDNYVDGGVRDILPMKALLKDDLKVGEVHVICLSPLNPASDKTFRTIIDVAVRSLDLLLNEILQNDYDTMIRTNRLIAQKQALQGRLQQWLEGKRIVTPFRYLPERIICDTTDFRRQSIQEGIAHGREIAARVLKDYPHPPPDSPAFPG